MVDDTKFSEHHIIFLEVTLTFYLTFYFSVASTDSNSSIQNNSVYSILSLAFAIFVTVILFRAMKKGDTKKCVIRLIDWMIGVSK